MHVEFLLEEESAQEALAKLAPQLLPDGCTARFHAFQGKRRLLAKLPERLRGYASWLPTDWRIVVVLDADSDDCRALKARLEHAATSVGLFTKTAPGLRGGFTVLNRLAVEELEAWFFGDVAALRSVYPRLPATLASKSAYRDPDAVRGGTWEALERVLQAAGYYPSGLPKIAAAGQIAAAMDPGVNRSGSFRCFVDGLRALCASE